MLVYLNQAIRRVSAATREDVERAVIEGALLRIRPVIMTVAATIGGLLPIMFGSGTGSEVMRRIAAPMVGGMVSATILTLAVIPALFLRRCSCSGNNDGSRSKSRSRPPGDSPCSSQGEHRMFESWSPTSE
jgi:Cu/Ag efflux pump CusA